MRKTVESRIGSLEEEDFSDRMLLLLVDGNAPTAEQQALAEAAERAGKPVLYLSREDERL